MKFQVNMDEAKLKIKLKKKSSSESSFTSHSTQKQVILEQSFQAITGHRTTEHEPNKLKIHKKKQKKK